MGSQYLLDQNKLVKYPYSINSLSELVGVHPDLVRFAFALANIIDCKIVSGVREDKEQNAKFKQGLTSKDGYIKKSKHQVQVDFFGHALDILPLPRGVNMYLDDGSEDNIRWGQFDGACHALAYTMGIKIRTGFKWRNNLMSSLARKERDNTLPDGNHVELVL